jgi:hypothetical protein
MQQLIFILYHGKIYVPTPGLSVWQHSIIGTNCNNKRVRFEGRTVERVGVGVGVSTYITFPFPRGYPPLWWGLLLVGVVQGR